MWSLWPKSLALAITAAFPTAAATATDLTGTVTHVRDGDTFEVGSVPIRLRARFKSC